MRPFSILVVSATLAALGACAARGPSPEGPPLPDVARALEEATAPRGASRLVFKWLLREQEARFSGEGVARIEEPYRARLDLFGPRGEGYLSAALIGDDLRLPSGAGDAPLPPPALLWSVLGALRAPEGATLIATDTVGAATTLAWQRGPERWSFEVRDGVVRSARWEDGRQGRQTVEVREVGTLGRPSVVVYRDWSAFRELTLEVTEAEHVGSFPPETWTPDPAP